jgi:hypothetical protein
MYYASYSHLFDTPHGYNTCVCVCVCGLCSIYMHMQFSYKPSNFTTGTQPRGFFTTYTMYMYMHVLIYSPRQLHFGIVFYYIYVPLQRRELTYMFRYKEQFL